MILGGRYRVEEEVTPIPLGVNARALDQETGQTVGIRRYRPTDSGYERQLEAGFERKVRLLQQVDHPHLVPILDYWRDDDDAYLVMPFLPGGTLADLLRRQPRPPLADGLAILFALSDALAAVHNRHIVHGDVRPGNVLLDENGRPQLSDFGIVRINLRQVTAATADPMDRVAYLSPEACNGALLDTRADIWSYGVILYELVAGRRPFSHSRLADVQLAILTESLPDPRRFRPEASDRLVDLIYRLLAKDRHQRIPDMEIVREELARIQPEIGGGDATAPATAAADPDSSLARPDRPSLEPVSTPAATPAASLTYPDEIGGEGPQHNLPTISTPFFGRQEEMGEIRRLLQDPGFRLMTLHGPGGIGKTRLAIQAAAAYLAATGNPTYLVDLTNLEKPELLATAVADAIGFRFFGTDTPRTQLINYLQHKQMLLVLDNFEHILPAARLLSDILLFAVDLQLLVTSRELLKVREERVLPVRGLPLPTPETPPAALLESPAVQLFLQASRRIRPGFQPTEADLAAIQAICQQADGIPLGIELAAGWMVRFTPAEIAELIRERYDFLISSQPELPPRHRSMRSVFDYSWRLLAPTEKQALQRLGVFRGGFDRDAGQQVAETTLATLNALTDKALLYRSPASGRFHMQDLLRQFAVEKLAQDPAGEGVALDRHADFYLRFARDRRRRLLDGRQREAMAEIEREMANVRAAWSWAARRGDRQLLQLGLDALYQYFVRRGWQLVGMETFGQAATALRSRGAAADPVLTRLLVRQGACARYLGRMAEARSLLQEGLDQARALVDRPEMALALTQLGASMLPGDPRARDLLQESLELAQAEGDPELRAEALNWLAFALFQDQEIGAAVSALEQSLSLRRAMGDEHGLANALTNLAFVYTHQEKHEEAQAHLAEAVQTYRRLNDLYHLALTYNNLSYAALAQGRYEEARQLGEQALSRFREVGDQKGLGAVLGNLSEASYYLADYEEALALNEQAILLYRQLEMPVSSFYRDQGRIALAQDRLDLAQRAFQRVLEDETKVPLVLAGLAGLAEVLARQGDLVEAMSLAQFVRAHPGTEAPVRRQMDARLAAWQAARPGAPEATTDRGLAAWMARFAGAGA